MVHKGFSRGCQRCRDSHTRCDLQQPSCGRCQALALPCSGARGLTGFLFKDATKKTAEKYIIRSVASDAASGANVFERDMARFEPSIPPDSFVTSLATVRPTTDVVDYAVNHWLQNYVLPSCRAPQTSRGNFDALPFLLSRTRPDSALTNAVRAVATQSFTYWKQDCERWRTQALLRAASTTRQALLAPASNNSDETLLAILLLHFAYQLNSARDRPHARPIPSIHLSGAIALAHSRHPSSFNNPLSIALLTATWSYSLQQDVLADPLAFQEDPRWRSHPVILDSPNSALTLDVILSQVLRLRKHVASLRHGRGLVESVETDHVQTLRKRLGEDLETWVRKIPKDWVPQLREHRASNETANETYASCRFGFVYNQWRCARLMWLGTALSSEKGEAISEECCPIYKSILAAAPFFMGIKPTKESLKDEVILELPHTSIASGGNGLGPWYLFLLLRWLFSTIDERELSGHKLNAEEKEVVRKIRQLYDWILDWRKKGMIPA